MIPAPVAEWLTHLTTKVRVFGTIPPRSNIIFILVSLLWNFPASNIRGVRYDSTDLQRDNPGHHYLAHKLNDHTGWWLVSNKNTADFASLDYIVSLSHIHTDFISLQTSSLIHPYCTCSLITTLST